MRSKAEKKKTVEKRHTSACQVGRSQKELSRIVVPSCRRKKMLDIGHRGLVGFCTQ